MKHSAQVVIDVGINRVEDASRKRGYRLAGDVHFESAKEKASLITPVPGGCCDLIWLLLSDLNFHQVLFVERFKFKAVLLCDFSLSCNKRPQNVKQVLGQ